MRLNTKNISVISELHRSHLRITEEFTDHTLLKLIPQVNNKQLLLSN